MRIEAIVKTLLASRYRAAAAMTLAVVWALVIPTAQGQGSRKDDIVFGPGGHPVAGATVRVCQPSATGTPCTPLATVYTDATLTATSANPFQTDGIGNYHFYAPAGRYQIQISSGQISGTITQPDVILPPDVSSSGAGNNISAFGLTLGGNLSVAGNANVSGTLTTSNFNPGAFSPSSLNVTGSSTVAGPRPYIDVTSPEFGAIGDGGSEQATGTIAAGSSQLTISPEIGTWKVGYGLHVLGAGASGDTLIAKISAINGNVFTLDRNASTSVTTAGVQDDDTLAIQAAIASYCASPGLANGGSIFFPPGNFLYSQPQSSNPSAIPFTTCAGLHFLGGNSGIHNGTPFTMPPTSTVTVNCGPSPNAQPGFFSQYPNGNVTFENLVIVGCNEAVEVGGAQVVIFKNTFLAVGATGLTDNAPLHVSDTFWIYFHGGGLNSTSPSVPSLLLTADACTGCYVGVGNFYMDDTLLSGGPIQFIERANATGEPSGHWVFRNITQESGNTDLIQVTNPGAYTFSGLGPITLDEVQQSDNSDGAAALINLNSAGTTLSGLVISNSFSGAGAILSPAVKITAGALDHYNINGCDFGCVTQVWNSSGKPMGNGVTQSVGGDDFVNDVSNIERLGTSPLSVLNQDGAGTAARFVQSGSQFASVGIDPANGLMFGSNNVAGWNAQIYQAGNTNLDVAFAANYPPTNVAGTVAGTGGAIGAGSYYVWITSTTTSSCTSAGTMSAPSNVFGPLTVTTSTSSFNLTWTAAATGIVPIQGYCVFVNVSGGVSKFSPSSALVSGATTTSATIGSFPNSGVNYFPVTYQMVQEHHITPTAAIWNNAGTPNPLASPPYTSACVVSMGCGSSIALSPISSDSFGRANASTLGTNWNANLGTMIVASNTATESGSGSGIDSWNGQAFLTDQFSRATVNSFTNGASDLVGVTVRSGGTGVDTEYAFVCSNGSSLLVKRVSGTQTTLVSGGASCAVGNTIELDVAGGSPAYLTALINGTTTLTATDSSSPIASGGPGLWIWQSSDSLTNWVGGSLTPGNGSQSVFSQPNVWTQPQTFASPITSGSLAIPNKTRTCNIIRGDQSGSALTTGNIQPQGSLCYVDAAATVAQVIVMVDAGASTVQLGYRHNGSTTAITSALTPASVSGITDHVACANTGGTTMTIEGNSVTCSSLSNAALTAGDFIETIGGAADGTSKRLSVALIYAVN